MSIHEIKIPRRNQEWVDDHDAFEVSEDVLRALFDDLYLIDSTPAFPKPPPHHEKPMTDSPSLPVLQLEAICMSLALGDKSVEAELRPAAIAAGLALIGQGRHLRRPGTYDIVVAGHTSVRGVGEPRQFETPRLAAEFLIGLVWKDDDEAQRLAFALAQEIDRRRRWTVTVEELRAWALTVEAV